MSNLAPAPTAELCLSEPTAVLVLQALPGRLTDLGGLPIRRLLPCRQRRLVGPWCFLDYELLAFGVKIGRPDDRARVERVVLTEPIEGGAATVVAPVQLGGTRHISAAQFAQDQPGAVALVASQDGHFTVFAWCPREETVHAHRVETLLL